MFEKRVIPCLQLMNGSLVKTEKFNKYIYIGDPINTCRIFNELEVDEMIILDIRASLEKHDPDFDLLSLIAGECFMPLAYGGGIKNFNQAKEIFSLGYEKVILNSVLYENLDIIGEIANVYGSQSVVASVDVKKDIFLNYRLFSCSAKKKQKISLIEWIKELQNRGVGEIMITDIDHEGTWSGYNYHLVKLITENSNVPVIAHGGAGKKSDVEKVINDAGAYAAAAGSMFVFQGKDLGVLINYDKDYSFR
ncbi:imidazole glycerol phosphate synthase subunit HisF [Lachnospiraceae bacterium MD335]|nr:imidazole glycerol phosphate synthase subunit HisF [Lachnospiraceae bacterium MD335]